MIRFDLISGRSQTQVAVNEMPGIAGKSVLVTGADGFIGSHLTEMLVRENASVRALCEYNSFNDWGWLEDLKCLPEVSVITGDIRDPHFCLELTRDIDVIFHLAALIAIPHSYRSPDTYIDTNVKGTHNLCHGALKNGARRLIHMSTSEVYGSAEYTPIDERHPLKAQSPYSASKIGADAIAASFHYSFSLPLIIARPFNVFGPRQSARAVIPTIISQLAAGLREVSLGNLTTTRDFTFVTDTCRGLLALAALEGSNGEVFNIGSNSEISIGDLFCLINELMGTKAVVVQDHNRLRPKGSEVLQLRCDNSKLRASTGFEPQVPFAEGLRRTIEWFREGQSVRRYKEARYNV